MSGDKSKLKWVSKYIMRFLSVGARFAQHIHMCVRKQYATDRTDICMREVWHIVFANSQNKCHASIGPLDSTFYRLIF